MTAQTGPREVVEVLASTPREALLPALLENLARGLADRGAAPPRVRLLRRLDDGHLQPIAAWRDDAAVEPHGDVERRAVPGIGVLEIAPRPDLLAARRRRLLDDTCVWLGAVERAGRAVQDVLRARREAEQREAEAERAQVRAARVREGERIRLVETITTATVHDVELLRRLLDAPPEDVDWPAVHASAERLIDELRDAVRGVFPAMLPDRGAEETLRELAAALPTTVDVVGDLGRRTGWDVESGFYHAVAGVLATLSRAGAAATLSLRRGAGLVGTVRASGVDVVAVQEALAADAERIASLGGELVVRGTSDGGIEVEVTMPDRGEVTSLPIGAGQIAARPVHARVAALLDAARLDDDEREACRDALVAPVALLVVQGPLPAPMPGVQTLLCDAAPDAALGAEIAAPDGAWGAVDAVVCALAPRPGFADALGSDRLLFRDGIAPAEAVATLSARAPVIAARRVLTRLGAVAHAHADAELRWQLDALRAGAHELAEDALLDEVARGSAHPLVDVEAVRLAGGEGGEPHRRLGLPPDAGDARLRAAALAAFERWQRVAAAPGIDSGGRRAADVLQRSAAGLLA